MSTRLLWLWTLLLSSTALAEIVQPQDVEAQVAGLGKVKASIRIQEGARPIVAFHSERGDLLLTFPLGDAGTPDPSDSMQPRGQILLRAVPGLPSPLIAVDIRNYYGTGYKDNLALVGAIDGKLSLLHMPWEAHNLGGIHLGALNPSTPLGVAQWNFEWADCHACPNPYEFRTFPWDPSAKGFVDRLGSIEITTKRYAGPQDAIRDLHSNYSNFLDEFQLLNE